MQRLRVAFVGKGGSGKSLVAGTLARLLAARGEPVLALDSDPLPGLAFSIGVDRSDAGLPDDAVEEAPEGERPRFRLRAGLDPQGAIEQYAAHGPDGVRFLQLGKTRVGGPSLVRSQFAFRQIIAALPEDWTVVGDLPGGTRQPFFGWGSYAQVILVVAEPTAASLLSARRLARLAQAEDAPRVVAVASKVLEDADAERVAARTGLEVVCAVPADPAVAMAERRGRPVIDEARDCPAVRAVASLTEELLRLEART